MIYLDYNATTPMDPRVLEAMQPYFLKSYGNAASRHHQLGQEAKAAVEKAREQVAQLLNADPREIIWTSGATEANNLALQGVAHAEAYRRKGRHLITVRTEHPAVLDPCRFLETEGFEVTYLPVDREGRLDLDQLAESLRPDTLLVSIMAANNEIGVLHPVKVIGALCRNQGILFHSDATQALGKEPLDVQTNALDLVSFSGHKMYAPKGVGGLYVRRRNPRVRLQPQLHGGGHERGWRSGTLNVPGIVGLGMAAELFSKERENEQSRSTGLCDRLEAGLHQQVSDCQVNGGRAPRLTNTSNMSFAGCDAEALLRRLPKLAASTASACTTAALQPSHVLGAMGIDDQEIQGSVRFSLGRFSTEAEIDQALNQIVKAVHLERESPSAPQC
jgi:cysteine desulfurase